jgi:hypothetical protein
MAQAQLEYYMQGVPAPMQSQNTPHECVYLLDLKARLALYSEVKQDM